MFTLALTFTFVVACSEGIEHGEGPEDEAAAGAGMLVIPVDLLAQADVTVEAALAAALARVPGGRVSGGELEEEDGSLIFSFDIPVDGEEGIEEVHVDAHTGEVVSQAHESADDEAAEADEDER